MTCPWCGHGHYDSGECMSGGCRCLIDMKVKAVWEIPTEHRCGESGVVVRRSAPKDHWVAVGRRPAFADGPPAFAVEFCPWCGVHLPLPQKSDPEGEAEGSPPRPVFPSSESGFPCPPESGEKSGPTVSP